MYMEPQTAAAWPADEAEGTVVVASSTQSVDAVQATVCRVRDMLRRRAARLV